MQALLNIPSDNELSTAHRQLMPSQDLDGRWDCDGVEPLKVAQDVVSKCTVGDEKNMAEKNMATRIWPELESGATVILQLITFSKFF